MVPATGADVERLLREKKLVVVDFYATWCGPCKAYSPKFDRIEREIRRAKPDASVAFVSVDIDLHQDVAREAKVMSVPTTVAWTLGRGLFGGEKKKQVLRFSGDRAWPELVRTVTALVDEHA
jgi:thiol-disulfide isomerase/thioredoxin